MCQCRQKCFVTLLCIEGSLTDYSVFTDVLVTNPLSVRLQIVETIEFTAEDDTLALQAPRKLDQITGHIRQEGTPVPAAPARAPSSRGISVSQRIRPEGKFKV